MSELVNLAASESEKWNKPIIWIKVNVGYILAEAEYMKKHGVNVEDIIQLANAFNSYYSIFVDNEIALYRCARKNESEPSDADPMIYEFPIQNMKGCFIPWLASLDRVVSKRQEGQHNLATGLMLTCGAEILKSHADFINAVESAEIKLKELTKSLEKQSS